MAKTGLTLRAAAKEIGCTHPALLHAIKTGRLSKLDDGTVDLAAVKEWWAGHVPTKRGRPRKDGTEPGSENGPVAELLAVRGVFPDRASAELHKASFAALSEELEYEKLAGSIVEIEQVARAVGVEYATVRQKLLAIPAEQAPRIHACKTVLEVQDTLLGLVTEALESLTLDAMA
jgi:hypothetical protein